MADDALLLIDDDRTVHAALDRELGDRVGRILHASLPEEGLRLALQERPDVVLLDLNMPRMDGLKVCRHLKETPSTRDIPVLFLTVDRNVANLARALECGGADYILKPFHPVELRARVAAALRMRRMIDLLRDQAWIDPLTGLKNRAAMDDALASVAAAFERVGQPSALMILDLDGFKPVNDTHGHGIGDELLRLVAGAIRATCRPYDTACRFGGDEFAVVFAQAAGADAQQAARRVLDAVGRVSAVGAQGAAVPAQCSAGLACTSSFDAPFEPAELFKAADAALYRAKRAGRGRLVVHGCAGSPHA
jgi:diguanylate cyclase (GGDEF)-like protein